MAVITGNGWLVGGTANDSITGGTGADILIGHEGSDSLSGGSGDDTLAPDGNWDVDNYDWQYYGWADAHNAYGSYDDGAVDHVNGGAGFDHAALRFDNVTTNIVANLSNPATTVNIAGSTIVNVEQFQIVLGFGHDTLTLGAGNDAAYGGAGNDNLSGNAGYDWLYGDAGNDTLNAGTGGGYMDGGAGDDRLVDGTGTNTAIGGVGNDTLVLAGNRADYRFERHADNNGYVTATNTVTGEIDHLYQVETIQFADGPVIAAATYSFTVDGTAAADLLVGTYLNDTISGGDGNDNLHAQDGDDRVYGGAGNDTLYGLEGNDSLFGDDGDDAVYGGSGNDNLDGGEGIDKTVLSFWNFAAGVTYAFGDGQVTHAEGTDTLISIEESTIVGSAHNDVLTGGSARDTVNGGAGNDRLNGGAGSDQLNGEAGDDYLSGGDGDDALQGGAGTDTLDGGEGIDRTSLNFWGLTSGANYALADRSTVTTWDGTKTLISIEGADMYGTQFDDALTGGSARDTLDGRDGNDTLNGLGGDDRLYGGEGDDTLDGGEGDDWLDAGRGTDILDGGDGIDRTSLEFNQATAGVTYALNGGPITTYYGIKTLSNFEGADFYGSRYVDVFTGGSARDTMYGRDGSDALNGMDGDDHLVGDAGDDILNGGVGSDTLHGGSGADSLDGGAGNDRLQGDSGVDSLLGGEGDDQLFGNGSTSTAVYAGPRSQYAITRQADGTVTVTDHSGVEGTDRLSNISHLQFSNGKMTLAQALADPTPVNSVPLDQIGLEDNNLVFSSTGGNALRVSETGTTLTVTLSVTQGTLTLASVSGLIINSGANGTDTLTVTGSASAINTALNGLSYRGNTNYEGGDTLTITTAQGTLSDTDTVAITLADDGEIDGTSGSDSLQGSREDDLFDLSQGGSDQAFGLDGNDGFFFGGALDTSDLVDGGAGGDDQVGLQGDYSGGMLLDASRFAGIETFALLGGDITGFGDPGTNSYDYSLTTAGSFGRNITINANGLRAGEDFTFNGSAETSGSFTIYGGFGTETLTGGAGSDGFYFGPGRFTAGDRVNGGAGGDDQLALRGNFTIDFTAPGYAGAVSNIETIALLSDMDPSFTQIGNGEFDYVLKLSDGMVAAGATLTISGGGLGATETMVVDGSAETNGTLRLIGGGAGDTLTGGAGADLIFGGAGADTLRGNGGADHFIYTDVSQGGDIIADFSAAQGDKIGMYADSDPNTDGVQEWLFAGSAYRADLAGQGQLVVRSNGDGSFSLLAYLAGDAEADMAIRVNTNLSANDILGATPAPPPPAGAMGSDGSDGLQSTSMFGTPVSADYFL